MEKPKIALITCYDDNYGACLQAYALQCKIEELFGKNSCQIVRYEGGFKDSHANKILPRIKLSINYRLKPFIKKNINKVFHKNLTLPDSSDVANYLFSKFRNKRLNLTKVVYSRQDFFDHLGENYDAYVSGSDQLWNVVAAQGLDPVYYLDFVKNNKKKIAYAASIGLNNIPENYQSEFKRVVENFNCVLMREIRGKEIVNELTNKDCSVVLDPTLLQNTIFWDKFSKRSKILNRYNLKKPYAFFYVFRTNEYTQTFIDKVKEQTGYDVAIIACYSDIKEYSGATLITDASPEDFVSLVKNSQMVITNSFHGTAFSVNFNKPFYAYAHNKSNSRIQSLLDIVCLSDRFVCDIPQTITKIDFTTCNQTLQEKRIESGNLLKKAIEESIESK